MTLYSDVIVLCFHSMSLFQPSIFVSLQNSVARNNNHYSKLMDINRHLTVFLESGIQEKHGWDVLAQGLPCVWSHMISRAEVISETSSFPFLEHGLVRLELPGTGAGRAPHGIFL